MSSPFSIFRKYAKELTVALIGLSMFAFILLDQIQPEQLPIVMGGLLGGILFWFLSKGTERRGIYTAVGVVAFGFLSSMFIETGAASAPVTINEQPIDAEELDQMVKARNLANRFITTAQFEALGNQAFQFRRPFQFGFGRPINEDVVLGHLLVDSAQDLNIGITDEVIGDFINFQTDNKMTRKIFNETLDKVGASPTALYNAIRPQLLAHLVINLNSRHLNPTPSDYWDVFRKTKVTQELQVIPVESELFESDAEKPVDSEIEDYFEKYKNTFAGAAGPGSPGFRVHRRVNVEYLMASREALDPKAIEAIEITDKDIEEFYEKNKETYRNFQPFAEGAEEEADEAAPDGPEMTLPEEKTPAEEKPAPEEKTEAPKAEQKSKPVEAEKESKPEEKPAAKKPVEEKPVEEKTEPAAEKPAEKQSSVRTANAAVFASVEDDAKEEEPAKQETKPEAAATETPKADAPKTEAPKAEASEEKADAPKPKAEETPEETADEAKTEDAKTDEPKAEQKPEFRPLDDELRAEIRERLKDERVSRLLRERMKVASAEMSKMGRSYLQKSLEIKEEVRKDAELTREQVDAKVAEALKSVKSEMTVALRDFADKNGLEYKTTGLISIDDLRSVDSEWSIGNASPAPTDENPFSASQEPVWYSLYMSQPDSLYRQVYVTGAGLDNNHYCYWKMDDSPDHVPTLNDETREKVKTAIIKSKAKPLAQKRAEEILELINKNEGRIAESITDQSITGKEDSEKLSFVEIAPFSWMVEVSAQGQQQQFNPQPEIRPNTNVDGLVTVGENFMQTTFESMSIGDVKVVPNEGASIFYIVKVIGRNPADVEGLELLQQSFVESQKRSIPLQQFFGPSPYAKDISAANGKLYQDYLKQIELGYNVKWSPTLAN